MCVVQIECVELKQQVAEQIAAAEQAPQLDVAEIERALSEVSKHFKMPYLFLLTIVLGLHRSCQSEQC